MKFATRRVGNTKLEITTLGLGGATLGGNVPGSVTDSAGRMIVLDGYDIGIRYFDTAPYYGYGRSEHVMGDELRSHADWVLSTKVGRLLKPRRKPQDPNDSWKNPHPFEPVFDYSYDGVMRSYEDSMQRLGSFPPQLSILVSCNGRRYVLKQRTEEEVEAVRETLGDKVTVTGFYSYGEIAPADSGGRSQLHNETMTITSFAER